MALWASVKSGFGLFGRGFKRGATEVVKERTKDEVKELLDKAIDRIQEALDRPDIDTADHALVLAVNRTQEDLQGIAGVIQDLQQFHAHARRVDNILTTTTAVAAVAGVAYYFWRRP